MELDIYYIAQRIGQPVRTWPGNCHGISELVVKALHADEVALDARVARGHYLGEVHARSFFGLRGKRIPFIPHSWIVTEAGLLIDPTRFAFESSDRDPFIHIGKATDPEYDEGGQTLRASMMGAPPDYNPDERVLPVQIEGKTGYWIAEQTGFQYPPFVMTYSLAMWLGNLPVPYLGVHARPIFSALVDAGHGAIIPIDNRRLVLGA